LYFFVTVVGIGGGVEAGKRFLRGLHLKQSPVVGIELAERINDLIAPNRRRCHKQHSWKQTRPALFLPAAVVVDVDLTLALDDGAALAGSIDLNEVAVLELTTNVTNKRIGLDDQTFTTRTCPSTPASWFSFKDEILDLPVSFEFPQAYVQLADRQDVISDQHRRFPCLAESSTISWSVAAHQSLPNSGQAVDVTGGASVYATDSSLQPGHQTQLMQSLHQGPSPTSPRQG